mmetsp:Transcript_51304/g.104371  ORF Transcript_51304/g.104371 Transcript_51304/m.104371 type:complete len:87 (+) Transcript_51304:1013-1273(+)
MPRSLMDQMMIQTRRGQGAVRKQACCGQRLLQVEGAGDGFLIDQGLRQTGTPAGAYRQRSEALSCGKGVLRPPLCVLALLPRGVGE